VNGKYRGVKSSDARHSRDWQQSRPHRSIYSSAWKGHRIPRGREAAMRKLLARPCALKLAAAVLVATRASPTKGGGDIALLNCLPAKHSTSASCYQRAAVRWKLARITTWRRARSSAPDHSTSEACNPKRAGVAVGRAVIGCEQRCTFLLRSAPQKSSLFASRHPAPS
jgi:hypothetical protein